MDESQRFALRSYITNLANELIPNSARPRDAQEMEFRCEEIAALVHSALLDVKRGWNVARRSVIPDEILAECFSWLDLRSRVRASHVSSLWRTTLLRFRYLWADIDLSMAARSDSDLIRTVLERSGSLSLHVNLRFKAKYPGPYECLAGIPNVLTLVLESPIDRPVIGVLTVLDIGRHPFRGLTFDTYPRLLHLKCEVSGERMRDLLRIFPSLVSLHVFGELGDRNTVTPIPPRITDLGLYLKNDVYQYLTPWDRRPLRSLELGRLGGIELLPLLFPPALQRISHPLARHTDFLVEEMHIGSSEILMQSAQSVGRTVRISGIGAWIFDNSGNVLTLAPRLATLRRLTVTCGFCTFMVASLDLPLVEELTLGTPMSPMFYYSAASLRVPVLKVLILRLFSSPIPEDLKNLKVPCEQNVLTFLSMFSERWSQYVIPAGRRVPRLLVESNIFNTADLQWSSFELDQIAEQVLVDGTEIISTKYDVMEG